MSVLKADFSFKLTVAETPEPVPEKANLNLPIVVNDTFAPRRSEPFFIGNHFRNKLERQFQNQYTCCKPYEPKSLPPTTPKPTNLTAEQLEKQHDKQLFKRIELTLRQYENTKTLKDPHAPFLKKLIAYFDNQRIGKQLDRLATRSKITDENLAAIKRGDKRAIAFFDAMNKTNQTGDPWDMNPGDAFRNSLNPEAQRKYDETLAKLRNDPRVQFEFKPGAIDNPAFREIALRGMVAATFGRPQDLDQQIAQAAAHSDNGKYTITMVPDSYVGADGKTGWGARAGRDGIEAKQGFTIQQIARENDNLFIHEFSHTLQADSKGAIHDLPQDFGFFDKLLFKLAFNDPKFQKYIGQTKIDGETFPGIQNRFRQNPQALKNASPLMYALMVDYSGFDPLTGSLR